MPLIRHGVVEALTAVPFARMFLVVGLVHQEGERDLEHLEHLPGVEYHGEARPHEGDHRTDLETGAGAVAVEIAERLDEVSFQADLLPSLPEGAIDGGRV